MHLKRTLAASALGLAMCGAASAAVIDFDTSNGVGVINGQDIYNIMSADGSVSASVTTIVNPSGSTTVARAYATVDGAGNPRGGRDPDIEPTYVVVDTLGPLVDPINNVLVVDETPDDRNNTGNEVDDNRSGGVITFNFTAMDVLFSGVTFIDDGSLVVSGSLDGNAVFSSVIDNGRTENALQRLALGTSALVDQLTFDFGSNSGAIDNVMVSAVPLPAGVALLMTGLGALGFARRRKST